jgi:hypothetical protein
LFAVVPFLKLAGSEQPLCPVYERVTILCAVVYEQGVVTVLCTFGLREAVAAKDLASIRAWFASQVNFSSSFWFNGSFLLVNTW